MTWMPDRETSARRRRRRGGASQSPTHQSEWPSEAYELYETDARRQHPGTGRLGIPRILGRRARWVGARLRREG